MDSPNTKNYMLNIELEPGMKHTEQDKFNKLGIISLGKYLLCKKVGITLIIGKY
jgi:hypothetical protein